MLAHAQDQDNIIWDETWDEHPLGPWEWWFADGIYKTCDQVQTKYTREDGGVLSDFQVYINRFSAHFFVDVVPLTFVVLDLANKSCRLLQAASGAHNRCHQEARDVPAGVQRRTFPAECARETDR